jgi:hypothetical protein
LLHRRRFPRKSQSILTSGYGQSTNGMERIGLTACIQHVRQSLGLLSVLPTGRQIMGHVIDRAERREEIKLVLEYLRLVTLVGVVAAAVFGGLQWRIANQNTELANKNAKFASQVADENVFRLMLNEWSEHLRIFLDQPHLRPYFESEKVLSSDDPNYQSVLAFAEIRIDLMDSILLYATSRKLPDEVVQGWEGLFNKKFKTSPVMCDLLRDSGTRNSGYGQIGKVWERACRVR